MITSLSNGGTLGGDAQSIITTKKLYPVNSLNCLSCGAIKP